MSGKVGGKHFSLPSRIRFARILFFNLKVEAILATVAQMSSGERRFGWVILAGP